MNRRVTRETEMLRKARLLVERAGGCPNRIQGAHQVQDFTKAVPRSGGILIGIFFRVLASCPILTEYDSLWYDDTIGGKGMHE